jgi:monofunctional biosynthetic peptidoglycan transglycosylase
MRVPEDRRRPAKSQQRQRSKAKSRPRLLHRLLRWAATAIAFLLLLSVLIVLPLRFVPPPVTAFMLQDDSGRDPLLREWTPWDNLGDAIPLAVIAAEDQRFADHSGFDVDSIRDSLKDADRGGRLRGASTITQQLVKNLYLSPSRSFWRKGIEAYLTIVTELLLPKQRILELYVNVVELGPGIYGVTAASEEYFGKPPAALSDAEAALLAAALPNPVRLRVDRPSEYLRDRQAWILRQIERLRREHWLSRIAG